MNTMFEFYLNLFDQKKLSTNDYIHSFAQFINLNGIQMTNVDELKDDEEYYTFNIPYKRQSYEYRSADKKLIGDPTSTYFTIKEYKDMTTFYLPNRYNGIVEYTMKKETKKAILERILLTDNLTKHPTCAICLEDKFTETGPGVAVSFNDTICNKHIFHEGCVKDGRVKICPSCSSDKKELTRVDLSNLLPIYKYSEYDYVVPTKLMNIIPGTKQYS